MDRRVIHICLLVACGAWTIGCSAKPREEMAQRPSDDASSDLDSGEYTVQLSDTPMSDAPLTSGETPPPQADAPATPQAYSAQAPATASRPMEMRPMEMPAKEMRPKRTRPTQPWVPETRDVSDSGDVSVSFRMTDIASDAAASVATEPLAEPAVGVVDAASPDAPAFTEVDVFYATDRALDSHPLSAYQFNGQRRLIGLLGIGASIAAAFMLLAWMLSRTSTAKFAGALMALMLVGAGTTLLTGEVRIEKRGVMYSGDRGELVRGVCRVTIPKSHVRGQVERPSLLKFEIYEDQEKHLVLTAVDPLDQDRFTASLNERLGQSREPDLLVFIHGYNVDFEAAVTRTAQIAVDLPFDGVPICYSWPSQGTLLGYPVDENNAAWTVGHLKQFLTELVETSEAKSIHVVAHSMGNRAMTAALQQMSLKHKDAPPLFDRVVLAAPDVDADLFRKDLAPALVKVAKQVTLYASSDDQALIASKQVHGYPRAGETGDHLVVVEGVDTIDVSGVDLSLLGHSYYGDSELMLRDLFEVLLSRLPAAKRSTLVSRNLESRVYWQLAGIPHIATSRK